MAAYLFGAFSMLCVSIAAALYFLGPNFFRWFQRLGPAALSTHLHTDPAAMARDIERRRQQLDDQRHRIRARAAKLRGLKWDMEHLGASHALAPYGNSPTLGQQIYKNRIARLDREIYRLRVCEKLAMKMRNTANLILEMLAVEAHADAVMPELADEPDLLGKQLARYRELQRAFDELKLRSLAADEVEGLLES